MEVVQVPVAGMRLRGGFTTGRYATATSMRCQCGDGQCAALPETIDPQNVELNFDSTFDSQDPSSPQCTHPSI